MENQTIFVIEGNGCRPSHSGIGFKQSNVMYTLNTTEVHAIASCECQKEEIRRMYYCIGNGQADNLMLKEKAGTLNCMHDQQALLELKGDKMSNGRIRRLTPNECEALQGFPKDWTLIGDPEEVQVDDFEIECDEDGNIIRKTKIGSHTRIEYYWKDSNGNKRKCSDALRYKALGNSIAVGFANNCSGFWMWLMKRISAQYERNATLGSLFDGISGFPLAWARYNGKNSCRWASEIEEFPAAVCKAHFGDEDAGIEGDLNKYL